VEWVERKWGIRYSEAADVLVRTAVESAQAGKSKGFAGATKGMEKELLSGMKCGWGYVDR
jgi:hypothetical protein